jgi:hypothetical protein
MILLQAAEAAAESGGWWQAVVGSGLLVAVLGLVTELLRQRQKAWTKERAAGALRGAIDGFAREMAAEGRPSVAKELTRRIDSKLTEAGEKVKAHNDEAVVGLGTLDVIHKALRGLSE